MSTNDNTEQILREWSSLWVARDSAAKDHLSPMCPHVTDAYRELTPEQKPAPHVDLCSWCLAHYHEWSTGVHGPDGDCERCGGETSIPPETYAGQSLCDDCFRQVRLGR